MNHLNFQRQQGAALIVSLVILTIVTILGVTSMQSSNADLKMAASMRDRGVAFEAAEAVLAIVEEQLAINPPSKTQLLSTCTGSGCFNSTCAGGLCFEGEYLVSFSEYECQTVDTGSSSSSGGGGGSSGKGASKKSGGSSGGSSSGLDVAPTEFWSDATLDVWNDSSKHQTVKVTNVTTDVKYIIEFLCYVARDETTPFSELAGENNNGAPLFRITALADGNGNRASVALQSTYKVLNGH